MKSKREPCAVNANVKILLLWKRLAYTERREVQNEAQAVAALSDLGTR